MDIKLKNDGSIVDKSVLCRGCLMSYGEMKNMTDWGLSEDFYRITNIQVLESEGITELLCFNCEDTLVKCKQWAAQCRESDAYLRNTAKKKLADNTEKTLTEENKDVMENTSSCLLFGNNLVITIMAPDSTAKIPLPCPHKCQETFLKKPDLLHHMIKKHHVDSTFAIDTQYYCSVYNCAYYVNSGKNKFFTGRKFLNQHYNKVHGESYTCDVCRLKFSTSSNFHQHFKTCNTVYECQACTSKYKSKERLLVHLLRRHPSLHKQYKDRKGEKRKMKTVDGKKTKPCLDKFDYICDSPKRSSATQTLDNIRNDVTLSPWPETNDGTKRDEISTQTVFEDSLSMKSNEEESIFFSETVSLSDIQTQTFPVEFGLSRSNKETITSETQLPYYSLKGTQTCLCLYDSPGSNRFVDSLASSPGMNLTSTETQTGDLKDSMTDLLSSTSIETQTCFDELKDL